ncbi:class I tRNA ligase family protein [Yeosuana marina]|uniref:class I tRNA ligase family protein n=1 Tax=Yeosuana marina TaxID=1565536 RepID=UPI0030C7AFE8
MANYIVTIAPPTPNGDMHLGHLSGPFLAADIFTRIRRLKGDKVFFTTYSDDYQDYVARKALELNETRFDLASKYGSRIAQSLIKAEIEVDWFMKSYENIHYKEAILFLLKNAIEKNAIGQRASVVPYSFEDKQYGYEAFAKGVCNYCGAESDASQCEACANSPILGEMGDMISTISKKPMVFVDKNRAYLRIHKYVDFLKELYQGNPIRKHLRDFIDNVLLQSDLEWYIDRPDGNGIDLFHEGKNITLHTWFSGLAGYLAASKEYWEQAGQPDRHYELWYDQNTSVVNFLGFDCSFSHAIVYPSLASNINGLTQKFTQITNKFLQLNGGDFSTSRNHAIWVDDILEQYPVDGVRFYLALVSPEFEVTNFDKSHFENWMIGFFEPAIYRIEQLLTDINDVQVISRHLKNNSPKTKLLGIYLNWESFSKPDSFSISGIAKALHELLEYVSALYELNRQEEAITAAITYLILSKPVHPRLSSRFIEQNQLEEISIFEWLAV